MGQGDGRAQDGETVTVIEVGWKTDHSIRTEWIDCPRCNVNHPTEFIWGGQHWIGFCHVVNRPLEALFEEST